MASCCGAIRLPSCRSLSAITCSEGPMTAAISWRVLQIADSAFPTGGFAHSAGLEAATQLGAARTSDQLDTYIRVHLWNVGNASLPFVAAAYDQPDEVWAMDARIDAF